jgi:protein arginine kinase
MENWIKANDNNENCVISSRIRLARNIKGIPFPYKLDEETSKKVISMVEDAFYVSDYIKSKYKTIRSWDIDSITGQSFLERHLVSNKFLSNNKKSAFIVDDDETVSIMINEEDHIRLQCITSGLNFKEAYKEANSLDNLLEENLDVAFDEKFGYLTACPTNIGTGLRASVMLHLPALTINNEINGVLNAVSQVGMTIRGLYGEGSRALGDLYQISNQVSLGVTEEDILSNLTVVVNQIINQENLSREQLMKKYKYEIEDKVFRSLGILRSAVLLNSKECMGNLSNVRFGVEMGIIKDVHMGMLNSLLIDTQPASLQKIMNEQLSDKQRDLKRAELVRQKLKSGGDNNDI